MRRHALLLAAVVLLLGLASRAVADGLTPAEISKLNNVSSATKQVGLGTKLDAALRGDEGYVSLFWSGNLGHDVGVSSDGVLFGSLTPQDPTKYLLAVRAYNGLNGTDSTLYCHARTGGTAYTSDTTDANDSDANDITLVDTTGAADDCVYIGLASKRFARADIVSSTTGNFVGVVAWEYWRASGWTALTGVTDGTSALSAAGTNSATWTLPTDWATCQVNSVTGYWVRCRITTATSGGGALGTKVYAVVAVSDPAFIDDTTDASDAGAGDCDLLPLYPVADDAAYVGKASRFCKLKVTLSQAMTVSTGVITPEYSTVAGWSALTCADNSTTWKAGTSTYWISWVPPADWASKSVNGSSAYWLRFRLSTAGVTAQPIATRMWVSDLTHGTGLNMPRSGTITGIQTTAQTVSGTTADSKFIVVNLTKGTYASYTWTKATNWNGATVSLPVTADDDVALVQCQEDGATEFANTNWLFQGP